MVLRTSTDNGASWSTPKLIAPEHTKRHQVIAGTIRTREGWLVQACDAGPGSHDGAAVQISKDGGKTWCDPWDGAPLPDFKEGGTGSTIAGIHAGIVQLGNGSLMAMGRGNSIRNKEGKLRMPMSISEDMGKTCKYVASELPPIDGGQRLVLMRLNEGPLLLVSFTDHPQRTPLEERGLEFKDKNGNVEHGRDISKWMKIMLNHVAILQEHKLLIMWFISLVADCITASIWHGSKNKIKKVCFCCPFPITSVVL